MVKVLIHFWGTINRSANTNVIFLDVPEVKSEAIPLIKGAVEGLISDKTLYSVLLNGKSMTIPSDIDEPLKDGDEFSIVPIIIGG